METEASAIARKVRNYLVVANDHLADEQTEVSKNESVVKSSLLIFLMSIAVVLTHSTLYIVKLIKKLEG